MMLKMLGEICVVEDLIGWLFRIIYYEEEKFDKKNFEDNEESNNNIEGNNEKNKINESWIVGNENNGIDIVNGN